MLSAGDRLGPYEVVELLGAGGMGEVYRARDPKLGRDVALKVLPQGSLADEAARKRFRKEALALSRLSHPHIASIHDFATTDDGTDVLVMELVPGPSLAVKLKRGLLPEKEVVGLGAQLARALVAAHAQGVVHRDLKPANVKLTADGLVKVLDFGLARSAPAMTGEATTDTASGIAAGTPPYMSPEQLLGKEVDERTDVYAAGVVLYEMAVGRRPFGEASGAQLVAKVLSEPVPSPREANPALSPVLEQVILKATDKDRELRHQSAKDLLVDLERLAAGAAAGGSPTGRVPVGRETRPRARRARWPWIVAGITALAGALGLGPDWWRRPGVPRITATRSLAHTWLDGAATDGTTVYYSSGSGVTAVPMAGGPPRRIPTPWSSHVSVKGLRRDPPELLLQRGTELWRLPLGQGAPARLEGLPPVTQGAWSPRGDRLAWVEDRDDAQALWVGDAVGANPRRLVESPKDGRSGLSLWMVGWHPSGEWIRYLPRGGPWPIVDASMDGHTRQVAMVVPEDYWTALPAWSADGSLFLLGTRRGVVAFREHGRSGQPRSPINLGGPTHTYGILATPDVRKLLAYVVRDVSEVVRLDRARGALTPVFDDGTRALNLAYSPDGSRVAWVADDTERLWVSRSDGSERVPLSDARVFAAGPLTWSPDGSRIAFTALHGETGTAARHRLHLASPGDGTVEPLTEDDPGRYQLDPCWSPDGRWLVYGLDQRAPVTAAEFYLRRVDLETRRVTRLEGSEGLWNPRCSADGRILARDRVAGREHEETRGPSLTRRLAYKVRDPASGAWTAVDVELPAGATPPGGKLASGDLGYETWSRDGRQVYAYQSPQRRIVRFGAASGRLETVAQLTDLEAGSGWFSLDPGDVPLLLRSRPQQELVVMDLEVE